ncbi:MAG TPA: chain-length determining protein [Candidatus Limosilactobacillus intestinigallinarum]|nr:chain-length determining protein [Candidatus Limosilactobacillus intestinigallinarum]
MNTYSFSELVKKVWKSLVVIIIFALIGGIGMGILAKKHQTTTYTAETSVIISHNLEENRHIKDAQDSMVNADMNMMPTYESIAKNTATADEAHKLLPKKIKKNYSVSDVDNAITAQTKPQSLVMNIRAESKSSKDSIAIANASAKALKEELPKLQSGVGHIRVVNKANENTVSSKTSPSIKKHAVVGIVLGGLVGLIVSFVAISYKEFIAKRK